MPVPEVAAQAPAEGQDGQGKTGDGTPRAPHRNWAAIALLAGVLAVFFAVGIARAGFAQSLHDLGLRRPALAAFTLLLVSPAFFELAYPWLRRRLPAWRRGLDRVHDHSPYLTAIGAMMVVMRFENTFDLRITAALGLDWTGAIHALEGDAVERFQLWLRGPDSDPTWLRGVLDPFLTFVYLTVFALYHLAGILGFVAAGRTQMVRRFTLTWVGIYAAALPFYLFFPVNEVWVTNAAFDATYGWTGTANVLGDGSGLGQDASLAIASINNCFPSLHNAFAWALPFLLWRSGWRRTGNAVAVVASLITLSTLYLGIHWVTDMVAGIALAWGVVHVAVRLEYRLDGRMRLRDLRWVRRPVSSAAPSSA